ncbi:unnamed protein product [Pleuronectes platessa]|uniref:Uncharacterized protein n=1 Tax=Pleuronectes platessa TaxID=8262 RepID=A0A9N7UK93_PLEPL|nr:unnamed protein product [Pleuronectes platessa]
MIPPKEFYRGGEEIRPNSCLIPNTSGQVRPTAGPIPAGIVQSRRPFTVGASQEPIRLAVERKPEKLQPLIASPGGRLHWGADTCPLRLARRVYRDDLGNRISLRPSFSS